MSKTLNLWSNKRHDVNSQLLSWGKNCCLSFGTVYYNITTARHLQRNSRYFNISGANFRKLFLYSDAHFLPCTVFLVISHFWSTEETLFGFFGQVYFELYTCPHSRIARRLSESSSWRPQLISTNSHFLPSPKASMSMANNKLVTGGETEDCLQKGKGSRGTGRKKASQQVCRKL